jgi:hypothetical protein
MHSASEHADFESGSNDDRAKIRHEEERSRGLVEHAEKEDRKTYLRWTV